MLGRLLAFYLVVLFCAASPAPGEVLTYEYTGTVFQTDSVLGLEVALDSPVSGRFSYAYPDTIPNDSQDGFHLYLEHIVGGFTATFASSGSDALVEADDYAVQVRDKTDLDGFAVTRAPFSAIPPTEPITVDGQEYADGVLRLDFVAMPSLYSSSAVPASLNLDDFMDGQFFRIGNLSRSGTGGAILFEITSLEQVPEPSSLLLLVSATGVLACVLMRRKRMGMPRTGRG